MILSKVDLPDMSKGDWKVEKFVVDCMDCSAFQHRRAVPVGEKYTRLERGTVLVMSDTPAERLECFEAYHRAEGICLVNGLGLGMLLKNMLAKTSVTEITVVEISQDLIDLISPYYTDTRLTYVCADALTYNPPKGKRYNMVWHDIWDDICSDNLEDMAKLHRKYGRICDWQGSWMKDECKRGRS
jgi:hypothetical protein